MKNDLAGEPRPENILSFIVWSFVCKPHNKNIAIVYISKINRHLLVGCIQQV